MKKVIVTGGYGFIGSNLINLLIKKKYFVINIDKISYSSNVYNLKGFKKNYIFYQNDINEKNKILQILKKFNPDIVFNLAAETHVDRSIDGPEPFVKSNILGVFNLLETIKKYIKQKKNKIKLIHVSTDEVYGDVGYNQSRSKETSAYQPSSPYAASKASADHLIKSYIRTYNFPAIITNCSNNYGPKQFPEKLIPKIIFNILNELPIPIYSKGLNSREWLYVEDHCKALEIISRKGKIGENYNIGSGNNLTNIQLVNLIFKIIKHEHSNIKNKSKIIFVKDRPGHDSRYALNSNKIRFKLNWKPQNNVYQGLRKTINWYIDHKEYFKHIDKKNYVKRLGLKI